MWRCGLGKTTQMMQLGHALAAGTLPSKGKKTLNVNLVLANGDLVQHYRQLFAEKQGQSDPRIVFEWI